MKVRNSTGYDTRTLRSVLIAVHNAEPRGKLKTWKHLIVNIVHTRAGNRPYTGHAYYHGHYCHLSVPRGELSIPQFAALWRHEMWHLYGIKHCDYPPLLKHAKVECVQHVSLTKFGGPLQATLATPEPQLLDLLD